MPTEVATIGQIRKRLEGVAYKFGQGIMTWRERSEALRVGVVGKLERGDDGGVGDAAQVQILRSGR